MKTIKILFGLFALIAIAYFSFTSEALASLAVLPVLASMGDADKQEFAAGMVEAMRRENPGMNNTYIGVGDETISFSGGNSQSFVDEINNTAEFSIRLTNSTPSMQKVVLFPGYFNTFGLRKEAVQCPVITTTVVSVLVGEVPTNITVISSIVQNEVEAVIGYIFHDITAIVAAGINIDAVIADATIKTGLVCESLSKGTIQDFIKFCMRNPTRITEMTVASNNVQQYNRKITIKRLNPTNDFGDLHYIRLQEFFKTGQYRTEKIIVDTDKYDMQFDDQSIIIFEIESANGEVATVTDITMKLGASLNKASWLNSKAAFAKRVIRSASAGLANLIK